MIEPFELSGLSFLGLLAGGVVLLLVLRGLGLFLSILPMSRDRREFVARAGPVVATLVTLAYVLFAAGEIFKAHPQSVPFALLLVLFGFGAATWFAIRDVLAGVFLKAGRACQVDDHVRIGGIEGRVQRLGYRVICIETSQGEEAIVPYSRVARDSILRTPEVSGAALHVFRVRVPPAASIAEVKRSVRESALGCHWASVIREPELSVAGPGEFEVGVYSLDHDHGPEVEAVVRKALARTLPGSGAL